MTWWLLGNETLPEALHAGFINASFCAPILQTSHCPEASLTDDQNHAWQRGTSHAAIEPASPSTLSLGNTLCRAAVWWGDHVLPHTMGIPARRLSFATCANAHWCHPQLRCVDHTPVG